MRLLLSNRRLLSERGATSLEVTLSAALVTLVTIVSLQLLGNEVTSSFVDARYSKQAPAEAGGTEGGSASCTIDGNGNMVCSR